MSRKSIALPLTALALLVAAGGGFWFARYRPIAVEVARIEHNVPIQVFGLGTVEARVASKVGFKTAGVLTDLRADVRDRVAKGTIIARLDDREQSARVGRTKAAIEQTEASLQRATASLEKAQANYVNAKSINERRQKLLLNSNTSLEIAGTSKAAEDAARADVALATSDVQVAKAAINDARAQRDQETATLAFHTLTAPYDAMVISRTKELGSALGAGEPVFALIDPQTVWALAYIDESRAGDIRVGQPAMIALRSMPGQRFPGKVARIQPESDRVNEERRVEVVFDSIPDNFHLGEQVEVFITTATLADALLAPTNAIEGLNKGHGMTWTVEDGRLQRRTIMLGRRLLDGRYEITGGLPDGAAIVGKLRDGLREGRKASVADGPAQ